MKINGTIKDAATGKPLDRTQLVFKVGPQIIRNTDTNSDGRFEFDQSLDSYAGQILVCMVEKRDYVTAEIPKKIEGSEISFGDIGLKSVPIPPAELSLGRRMLLAAGLNPRLYKEIEADSGANRQAIGAVILSSVATGVSFAWGGLGMQQFDWPENVSKAKIIGDKVQAQELTALALGTIVAVIGWFFLPLIIGFIDTLLKGGPKDQAKQQQLRRAVGFSSSPGLLFFLIPLLYLWPGLAIFHIVINIVALLWMMAATVVSVKESLNYTDTSRAVTVTVVGWLATILFFLIVSLILTVLLVQIGGAGAVMRIRVP